MKAFPKVVGSFLGAGALAMLSAGPLLAGPMTLEALSQSSGNTLFTVNFDDADGDLKLDFGELTAFSGFTVTAGVTLHGIAIDGIPNIPDVADCGGSAFPGCSAWDFGTATGSFFFSGSAFDYRITGAPDSSVPVSGTLLLMLPPLAALGVLRRRRA